MAIRHPDRVRNLVVMSTVYARQGWYPEVLADFDRMGPETAAGMERSPLAQLYPAVSWPNLFAKIGDLQRQPYDWSREIAALPMPVLPHSMVARAVAGERGKARLCSWRRFQAWTKSLTARRRAAMEREKQRDLRPRRAR
jgi:pimeloyl-ACP methyl ester carboxylesterase